MIKFEHTEVLGWEYAIRGMRNPLESWGKSDTWFMDEQDGLYNIIGDLHDSVPDHIEAVYLGQNDRDLMIRLRNAGTDHRKFMRMIVVYVDITAPLYWWKEFDTYKVGTVANSCSTMHKIHAKEFMLEDFSYEHLFGCNVESLEDTIKQLNFNRHKYLKTKDKNYWWQMIQLLPSSYNQRRTVMLNYEVLANIYKSRKNHKLDEWSIDFMEWIKSLPYAELITGPDIRNIPIAHEIMEEAKRRVREEIEEELSKILENRKKQELISKIDQMILRNCLEDGLSEALNKHFGSRDDTDTHEIAHLVDITTVEDENNGVYVYAIAPGVSEDELTEYEKQLLKNSKEYLEWKESGDKEVPGITDEITHPTIAVLTSYNQREDSVMWLTNEIIKIADHCGCGSPKFVTPSNIAFDKVMVKIIDEELLSYYGNLEQFDRIFMYDPVRMSWRCDGEYIEDYFKNLVKV